MIIQGTKQNPNKFSSLSKRINTKSAAAFDKVNIFCQNLIWYSLWISLKSYELLIKTGKWGVLHKWSLSTKNCQVKMNFPLSYFFSEAEFLDALFGNVCLPSGVIFAQKLGLNIIFIWLEIESSLKLYWIPCVSLMISS